MSEIIGDYSRYSGLYMVDVEASSPSPMTGVMTEFSMVNVANFKGFYAHLYDYTPHPDIPALPVVEDGSNPHAWFVTYDENRDEVFRSQVFDSLTRIAEGAIQWLKETNKGNSVLVSDNNGFDAMWMTCFFDSLGFKSPFGFSSRRIGDFYAGTQCDYKTHNSWKRLRRTKHTHNPYDDACGNVEALRSIFDEMN